MTQRAFGGTREEWCERVLAALVEEFAAIGISHPDPDKRTWRVAVAPLRRQSLGVCHHSWDSADKQTNFITISTRMAEPLELVHTLAHELLHAFDNNASGHRGRWKRWAQTLGIQTKGHECTPTADAIFRRVLSVVGAPSRHIASVEKHRASERSQSPLVKLMCAECETRCYVNVGQKDRPIKCGACNLRMIPFPLQP